ncbi:MAG: GNAT family N-acetyltransferase [Promethearchaeota archaeon]
MKEWILRRYGEGPIEPFVEWRKLVGRHKTLEYLEWEYKNGPWGSAETWIADIDGQIVGQYTMQRYECFFFGKKVMASLSIDNAVHPDYRRRGIYVALEKQIMREEGKNNVIFSTGFPNQQALPGHLKNDWYVIGSIPLLVNDNIIEIKAEKNSRYKLERIQKFDKKFDKLSESFKDELPIYLNRTSDYLNWRFVEKPQFLPPNLSYIYENYKIIDKMGELVSYIVTKIYETENLRILHLIDFLVPDDEGIYQLILSTLINKAKSLGINTISLFLNKAHPFTSFLRSKNFYFANTERVYIIHININTLNEKEIKDERNHYITMADSDLY